MTTRIRSVTGVVIAATIIANAPWPDERVAEGPCDAQWLWPGGNG